jgi:hypothetical protein
VQSADYRALGAGLILTVKNLVAELPFWMGIGK